MFYSVFVASVVDGGAASFAGCLLSTAMAGVPSVFDGSVVAGVAEFGASVVTGCNVADVVTGGLTCWTTADAGAAGATAFAVDGVEAVGVFGTAGFKGCVVAALAGLFEAEVPILLFTFEGTTEVFAGTDLAVGFVLRVELGVASGLAN